MYLASSEIQKKRSRRYRRLFSSVQARFCASCNGFLTDVTSIAWGEDLLSSRPTCGRIRRIAVMWRTELAAAEVAGSRSAASPRFRCLSSNNVAERLLTGTACKDAAFRRVKRGEGTRKRNDATAAVNHCVNEPTEAGFSTQ